ncbi:MAG: hypothetical protein QXO03_03230 [Thermoplasmatales archaeon]
MWDGLKGNRRRNGIYGTLIGIVVGSILLYLSFYISFLYLLIPVIILVIFHYTKLWRFSDRTFYGFITIVVAFFIAIAGISTSITGAPHESTLVVSQSTTNYDVHFSYQNVNGNYIFNFTLPLKNVTNSSSVALLDLFTNKTILTNNATLSTNESSHYYSWNVGQLSPRAYVVVIKFNVLQNNTSLGKQAEFLGPVLVSSAAVILFLSESLILTYLLVTFLFFLAFAFFARAITTSRQRKEMAGGRRPPSSEIEEIQKKN